MQISGYRKITDKKWLNLFDVEYRDKNGRVKIWEVVSRKGVPKCISGEFDPPDAVVVVAFVLVTPTELGAGTAALVAVAAVLWYLTGSLLCTPDRRWLGVLAAALVPAEASASDDDLAAEYFEKALEVDADNMDSNFFYGEFLLDQKRYADAAAVLGLTT